MVYRKIKNLFYVDICVVSVESNKVWEKFVREATEILASGGIFGFGKIREILKKTSIHWSWSVVKQKMPYNSN